MFVLSAIALHFSLIAASAISPNPNRRDLVPRELGINCRGSGVCPLASFEDPLSVSIAQGLRDAIHSTKLKDNTMYNSGDHVICISESLKISISVQAGNGKNKIGLKTNGKIGTGGICVFPQHLKQPLSLGSIKQLSDALLKHGCSTCGSVPVHFVDKKSNDPDDGILTFNYVEKPFCVGNCLSAKG